MGGKRKHNKICILNQKNQTDAQDTKTKNTKIKNKSKLTSKTLYTHQTI